MPARQRQAGKERRPVLIVDLDVDDTDTGIGDVEDGVAFDGRHGVGHGTALRSDEGGLGITNEDGAWQGSFPSVYEGFSNTSGAQSVVLVGEGDYEGLYAWMDVTNWLAINGVVFSYPPPEAPAPPSAN